MRLLSKSSEEESSSPEKLLQEDDLSDFTHSILNNRKVLVRKQESESVNVSTDDSGSLDKNGSHADILNEGADTQTEYISKEEKEEKEEEESDEEKKVVNLKHLPLYPPSAAVKDAQINGFSARALSEDNPKFCAYLKSSNLNPENVEEIFKTLLEIEDLTNMLPYVALAQKQSVLRQSPGMRNYNEYFVEFPNASPQHGEILVAFMDELVLVPRASALTTPHSKAAIDILLPHPHETISDNLELQRIIGRVTQINANGVYFRVNPNQCNMIVLSKRYDIIFRPCRLPERLQHRALQLLAADPKLRSYLFPCVNPHKNLATIDLKLINKEISKNPEQLQAVRNIVEGPNPYAPYVIFGPPGTGKTTTIVEAIIQLRLHKPLSRILVTAGSNSACDTIALRICEYFKSNPAVLEKLKQQRLGATSENRPLLRIFSKSIVEKNRSSGFDTKLLEYSNYRKGHYIHFKVGDLCSFGIIVATLCTVGKFVANGLGKIQPRFTHIFIDEAGSCTETEALVGIMGIKKIRNGCGGSDDCRVILSGDHKQLGPVLQSTRVIELGFGVSLMERLLGRECYAVDSDGSYDASLQTRLRRNYRSHPEIVRLYNQLYYNNELLAVAKNEDVNIYGNWPILSNPDFPIIFQAVHGQTETSSITPSMCNDLEIEVLMWYLRRLLIDGIGGRRVQQTDIGIISPYKKQYKRIQQQLDEKNWRSVETGSVETYQGREKSIIIVSLVRSFNGLGFISNPRRLNVILSRAKSLLIVIGNPLTLRQNNDFKFIMHECRKKGTFRRKERIPIWMRSLDQSASSSSSSLSLSFSSPSSSPPPSPQPSPPPSPSPITCSSSLSPTPCSSPQYSVASTDTLLSSTASLLADEESAFENIQIVESINSVKNEDDRFDVNKNIIDDIEEDIDELKSKVELFSIASSDNVTSKNIIDDIEEYIDELKIKVELFSIASSDNVSSKNIINDIEEDIDDMKSKVKLFSVASSDNVTSKNIIDVIEEYIDELKSKVDLFSIASSDNISNMNIINDIEEDIDDLKSKVELFSIATSDNISSKNIINDIEEDIDDLKSQVELFSIASSDNVTSKNIIDVIEEYIDELKSKVDLFSIATSDNVSSKNIINDIEEDIDDLKSKVELFSIASSDNVTSVNIDPNTQDVSHPILTDTETSCCNESNAETRLLFTIERQGVELPHTKRSYSKSKLLTNGGLIDSNAPFQYVTTPRKPNKCEDEKDIKQIFNLLDSCLHDDESAVLITETSACPASDTVLEKRLHVRTQYFQYNSNQHRRIKLLHQIVQRCDKCPQNYLPVISNAVHTFILRYSREELLKFRPS